MLYKYPHAAFPYTRLIEENGRRGKHGPEFELIDTGLLDDDRYFDIDIEYAKADVDDILLRITASIRGAEMARLYVLPQAWFRNTWSWSRDRRLFQTLRALDERSVSVEHDTLGHFTLHYENVRKRSYSATTRPMRRNCSAPSDVHGYFKDAFHEFVVHGNKAAVNPEGIGTKVAGLFAFDFAAGASAGRACAALPLRP